MRYLMAVYGLASIPVLTFLAVMPFVGQASIALAGLVSWSLNTVVWLGMWILDEVTP